MEERNKIKKESKIYFVGMNRNEKVKQRLLPQLVSSSGKQSEKINSLYKITFYIIFLFDQTIIISNLLQTFYPIYVFILSFLEKKLHYKHS